MKITYVVSSDWAGLYVENHLYAEGHSISVSEVIELFIQTNVTVTEFEQKECSDLWIDDVGSLPENLAEVVWPGEYNPDEEDEFDDADGDYDVDEQADDDSYAGPDLTY